MVNNHRLYLMLNQLKNLLRTDLLAEKAYTSSAALSNAILIREESYYSHQAEEVPCSRRPPPPPLKSCWLRRDRGRERTTADEKGNRAGGRHKCGIAAKSK